MTDDQTHPINPDPEAPPPPDVSPTDQPTGPPSAPPGFPAYGGTAPPPYAMPLRAGAYPGYAVPERPRFVDQVLGIRAVIAVALACLLIGGLSGWILGRASANGVDGFGRGPGVFQAPFPGGQQPNFGQGPSQNGR
ncbi:MAG: hypothetical protein J2P22_19795 [Nocardioides sp.]|nr:hypothetical protein [Nocardioides sp.]